MGIVVRNLAPAGELKSFQPVHVTDHDQQLASWMRAAQAGDSAAYNNVLRTVTPFIKMVARRQGVPADLVDDVVQETLLTVHRIRQTYDPSRPFAAWLRTIAQRRAVDIMRGYGRTSMREIHAPLSFENHADPTENPEKEIEKVDRRNWLEAAVATLPPKQREAVQQLALDEKSLADASVATGATPGALKVNFHRALNALRAQNNVESVIDDGDSIGLVPTMCEVLAPRTRTRTRAFAKTEHAFVKSAA